MSLDSTGLTGIRLGEFIRQYFDHIVAEWSPGIENPADSPAAEPAIGERLQQTLARIADRVDKREAGADVRVSLTPSPASDTERMHDTVSGERRLLRQSIVAVWERIVGRGIGSPELDTLDAALDDDLNAAAGSVRGREHLLRALDRVSDSALTSADLETFLGDLLRITLEAADTVDTCAVLIREENRLRVRAAVGLEAELSSELSVAIGEGFAGLVAEQARPVELPHAAQDSRVNSPTIRQGVKALYGVPMILAGKVIGVAYVGSLSACEFPEDDKLLFRAMVSRAALAVVKAQILADLRRTEGAQRFLAEASREFAESLDYEATLEKIAHLAVPTIADWCLVDLLEDGRLRRVSVANADPQQDSVATRLKNRYPVDPDAMIGIASVLRSGRTEWRDRVQDDVLERVAWDADHLSLLRRLKLRAYILVPIVAKGDLLGTIALMTAESGRRYSEWDVEIAEDLARRAAMAIENSRLYQKAQEAVRLREQVLATVSHDLRNQVNVIGIANRLLRHTANLADPATERSLNVIERTSQSMQRLVNDLLDLASIQAGKLAVVATSVPLRSLIDEAYEMHEAAALASGVRLVAACEPNLQVLADRSRILQVLGNLLGNALRFTPIGGRVVIRGEAAETDAVVSVSDTGCGIAADHLPTLFEPYRTIARSGHSGSGLGLFIARGILERHGGRIWIESAEQRGTTVFFTLPRQDAPDGRH